jgi:hypothetical protein
MKQTFTQQVQQHPARTRIQKRSIQRIQIHIRNWQDNPHINISNEDLAEHIWNLECIITITTDHKVAQKAIKVLKLLNKLRRFRIKNGRSLQANRRKDLPKETASTSTTVRKCQTKMVQNRQSTASRQ